MKEDTQKKPFNNDDQIKIIFKWLLWLRDHYDWKKITKAKIQKLSREVLDHRCEVSPGSSWNPFSPARPKEDIRFFTENGSLLGRLGDLNVGTIIKTSRFSLQESQIFSETVSEGIERFEDHAQRSGLQRPYWAVYWSEEHGEARGSIAQIPKDWKKNYEAETKVALDAAQKYVTASLGIRTE